VKGLLTDFGGVLTSNVFDSFKAFCEEEGLPPDTVKRTFQESPEARAELRGLERGTLSVAEFESRFAPHIGITETDGLVERLFAGVHPDEAMLEAVRRAHDAGVRTAVISNSWGSTSYDVADWRPLFDAMVISGEVGLNKPQPEIFELALSEIGLPASACVFVDDLKENIAGAEALGITGILHRGADSTLPVLERLLGIGLR
jgi:epoxide hydrolase-like predicted phosphatase